MSPVGEAPFSLAEYPGFLPGLAASIVLGTLVQQALARQLGVPRAVAWLLVVSLGAVVAATLTPGSEASPLAGPGCDLSRIGPAPWRQYLAFGTASLNVLLFVPLGVALGLLPSSRTRHVALGAAFALPAAIETVQLLVSPLDRACQGADVFDNMLGLAFGVAAGSAGTWVATRTPSS